MENKLRFGGDFLTVDTKPEEIFIPEEFNEEQKMIEQTCHDFLETEIYPNFARIDSMEPGYMRSLVAKSGELGLLGLSVPAEYEGFEQSFTTVMRANEAIGAAHSFSVAFMAHTGIGTLPLLYYGNDEQKRKYIPKLASGEWAAAYCLTEPGAGSDANSGKTRATLSEDGKYYILNGQKMWITNGGFSDLQTVFAKIDNDRVLSAFLVERTWDGVVINPEEKKMGIKGSSTVQIFYNDVKVPVENLLGRRGEGFRIALNILHLGRIKLGATTVGACKRTANMAVTYANERKQFGTLISNFGAIKHKLAEQVIKAFVTESAVYRATMDIENVIHDYLSKGKSWGESYVEGSSRFAVECALLKVFGSEALDYSVDEAVQIYGGMGFSAEAPVDRAYRDSRINRIFEGTNEINRLLVVDTAMKSAMKGDLNLFQKAEELLAKIDEVTKGNVPANYYEEKMHYITNFKKAILMVMGSFYNKFKKTYLSEQEILMNISDMMMVTYAAESVLLRLQKLEQMKGAEAVALYKDIVDVYINDTAHQISSYGFDAVNSGFEGDEQKKLLKAVQVLSEIAPVNVKEARRRIANKLIEDNKYKF